MYLLQVKSGQFYAGYNNIASYIFQKTKTGLTSTFESALIDGSYRLTVQPLDNITSGGVAQTYVFDVSGGLVTNMRVEGSTTILSQNDGIYSLRFRSPALSGRVLTADGASGAANIRVDALIGTNQFSAYTDTNGYFGFNFAHKTQRVIIRINHYFT